ncbi:hypothetical protein B0J14DRAFT_662387 [Halenospora varia]|nr:hypothetical protein B0J14DRAFT_662387 [Halenospora varia]
MKLSAVFNIAWVYISLCAASEDTQNLQRDASESELTSRATAGTCSLGIARNAGDRFWDVTVWNVPQPQRQDVNIIAGLKNAAMDKGQSITVTGTGGLQPITITNVDNVPAFDYISSELRANWADPKVGITKVALKFEQPGGNLTWTTENCWAGSVVNSGRESWSCDFACSVGVTHS